MSNPDDQTEPTEDHHVSESYSKMLRSLTEQDRLLPINNVSKLMKSVLPPSAKVSREAKECVQECVSELISFVTSEASERCLVDNRKTVNGEDILKALEDLGFENYSEVLKIYLAKYREYQIIKHNSSPSLENGRKQHMSDQEQHASQQPFGAYSVSKEATMPAQPRSQFAETNDDVEYGTKEEQMTHANREVDSDNSEHD
ncbi:hypothetical protein ACO0RG_002411 [Hanseniaspora osmophila]|uniref:Transcriptional activator HAP3 n=1 Tax=Hanseniaspora osmophila TaxID=56408 RepID=A0A1E5RVL3_9ASCO|nr:Transcriptional activator HAP3 [Hanseniaspora osmophila]